MLMVAPKALKVFVKSFPEKEEGFSLIQAMFL